MRLHILRPLECATNLSFVLNRDAAAAAMFGHVDFDVGDGAVAEFSFSSLSDFFMSTSMLKNKAARLCKRKKPFNWLTC